MTLLPIVARELRVASRKGRSYWTRVLMAALGLVLFGVTIWFGRFGWRWSSSDIFQLLSWCAFVYCLLGGALVTADALSNEKRESTLGLLFLTDLRGYDIVLGKLVASSIGCLFGLLAMLPVLAIPLMMGGVQYAQFWRVVLSLLSTLLLSLSIGLLISGISRNPFRATAAALLAMLFLGFGLPALAEGFEHYWTWLRIANATRLLSPFFMHREAFRIWALSSAFSWPVLITLCLALGALGLTCWTLPRIWRDAPDNTGRFSPRRWLQQALQWNLGAGLARRRFRGRLLHANPFAWLAGRPRISSPGHMILSFLVVCGAGWLAAFFWSNPALPSLETQLFIWVWAAVVLHSFVLGKVSSAACERFGEDRQSGALELLLCTPLSVRMILRGQWHAIGRQLLGPAAIVLLVHGLVMFHVLALFYFSSAGSEPGAVILTALRNLVAGSPVFPWEESIGLLIVAAALLVLVAHWITLGWVGMWLALRLRQPRFAPWAALGIVLAPPWILFIVILLGLLEFESQWSDARWVFVCFRVALMLNLLSDLALSIWAAHKLRTTFRLAAADRFQGAMSGRPWREWLRPAWRWAAAAGAVAAMIGLFHFVENRRGKQAWAALQRELATRGERIDFASLLPAQVPPSENFALSLAFTEFASSRSVSSWRTSDPWQYMTEAGWAQQKKTDLVRWQRDYRTMNALPTNSSPLSASAELLLVLSEFDPLLKALRGATDRPFCRYAHPDPRGWLSNLPHAQCLWELSQSLRYRACAQLAEANAGEAFEDVKLCLYLADTLKDEPFFASRQMRQAILGRALQPVWEGLAKGCWTETQLAWFHERFSKIDLLAEFPDIQRGFVLGQIEHWEQKRSERLKRGGLWKLTRMFSPLGWSYQNQVEIHRWEQNQLTGLVDVARQRVFPARVESAAQALDMQSAFPRGAEHQVRELTRGLARMQTALDQAMVACALERHRLHHGEYPAELETLCSEYLERLPHDLIDGEPMRYERIGPGAFVLHSIGWNEQDERATSHNDLDWVWRYPAR